MKRVQMRRGVKLPANTRYVGRPSRWGNPYRPETPDPAWCGGSELVADGHWFRPGPMGRRGAVYHYRLHVLSRVTQDPSWIEPLRGHDLACYCPLDVPCHADVLLEMLAT